MTRNNHKNWVNSTRTIGIANINRNYRRKIIQVDLKMKLKIILKITRDI